MKGDMYDDGSPNPLVVKCPVCGGIDITAEIGTGQVRYHCNGCNYTWFLQKQEITTGGPLQYAPPSVTAPSYSITTPYNVRTDCRDRLTISSEATFRLISTRETLSARASPRQAVVVMAPSQRSSRRPMLRTFSS